MSENEIEQQSTEKKDTKLSIGERIQKKRKALDLSAEELVLLIASYDFSTTNSNEKGISLPTIYRYEKGEREPASREIKLLCCALNVSSDWLIFGESWNSEQEADTKLANNFKALIAQVNELKNPNLINRSISRDSAHYLKCSEIKNRTKS